MKRIIFSIIAFAAISLSAISQEASSDANITAQTIEIYAPEDTVIIPSGIDTSIVRIGEKDIKVIHHEGGTEIIWGIGKHKNHNSDKFEGHWEGLELGFNGLDQPDYGMYETEDFMSLNQGKSVEIDFNFYNLNIGLIDSYVGLISGIGIGFNDYRFENPYTIEKGINRTEPVLLDYDNLSKTKLAVSYLSIPILLEFQIPVNHKKDRLFLNTGVTGGVKIGSHTKVKHGDTKDKNHDGFNLNPFKFEATARIGFEDVGLFAKYNLSPLFQSDKGPGLTPFTIGISFFE